ncbi:MAG: hypothetical protein KGH71_01705, partial [Candidatus Micrarchaeota archaeon]|nr:hypothetical protein [Candidatus Micrarchaeota archaeon]
MESRGILIIGVILTLLASLGFGQFGGVNGGLAIIGIIVIIIAFFAWIGEKGDALKEKEHQKKIGWHKDL